LAVWRCLQHARRLELPQLRLFGKELIVRYGAKAPSRFFRAAAVEVPRESSSPLHERTELSSESQLSEPVAGHSTGLVPTSVDAVVPAAHDDHRQQTPIAPLEPIPLAQEPSSSESPVEQPAAPVARQLRVCPQCGKKLLPNESRCPACLKGPPAGAATAALRAEALRQPGRSEEQVARDALHMAEAPDSQYGGHAATIGLFAGHQGEVAGFAFPPQGGTVLSWTDSGELILWELGTRRIVERVPNVHMRINCAAFSPDGRRLLLAGEAEKQVLGRRRSVLALRDVPQWREIQRIDQAGNAAVEAWLSPDGRTAQTADELGQVRAWDLETGKMVRKFNTRPSWFSPRSGALVAFSPDGACAAVARPGGKLFLWDVASGKLRGQLSAGKGWWRQLPAHPGTINAVVFSSDGTQIVSASGERVIKSDYGAYGAMMGGLAGWLLGSLMGKLMDSSVSEAKATATTSIAVWNAETGKLRLQIPGGKNGHTQGIAYLSLSPDAARLVTSGYDGTCRLWDVSEARRAETLAIESGDGARRGIAATGRSLACWESSAWRFASDGEHAIASLATGVSVLKLAPAQQIELSTLPAVRLR
jgi:WD40 repeat protein